MSIFRSDRNRMVTPSSIEHAEVYDHDATFERNEIEPAIAPDPVVLDESGEEAEEESS